VITPSLPTLSITSAISAPISRSCALIAATDAISSFVLMSIAISAIFAETAAAAASIPRFSSIGLAPAARLRSPSVTM